MEFIHLHAQKDDANRRFDRLVKKILPQMPSSLVQKNIRTGFIRLNHKKTSHNTIIAENDTISVARILYLEYGEATKKIQKAIPFEANKIEVKTLFQNEHIWIVHKKEGLLSQKAQKNDISINCILKAQSQHAASLSFTPGVLHRLDKETSGLIVFSQSLEGAQWFSTLVQENSLGKKYLGICQGSFPGASKWEDTIDGEICISECTALEKGSYNGETVSLVEYAIVTGKKHQIRKQSALHGYPLLGDQKYGGFTDENIEHFLLHAYKLEFPSNTLGIPHLVFDPIPENFIKTAKLCLLKLDSPTIL